MYDRNIEKCCENLKTLRWLWVIGREPACVWRHSTLEQWHEQTWHEQTWGTSWSLQFWFQAAMACDLPPAPKRKAEKKRKLFFPSPATWKECRWRQSAGCPREKNLQKWRSKFWVTQWRLDPGWPSGWPRTSWSVEAWKLCFRNWGNTGCGAPSMSLQGFWTLNWPSTWEACGVQLSSSVLRGVLATASPYIMPDLQLFALQPMWPTSCCWRDLDERPGGLRPPLPTSSRGRARYAHKLSLLESCMRKSVAICALASWKSLSPCGVCGRWLPTGVHDQCKRSSASDGFS